MAASTADILAELKAGQDDIKVGQERLQTVLMTHGDLLRVIVERLGLIVEKLYPEETEGPTLQELLTELVSRVGDNGILIRRIDRRTESMALSLPDDVARAVKGGSGAAGNDGAGDGHTTSPAASGANGNGHSS